MPTAPPLKSSRIVSVQVAACAAFTLAHAASAPNTNKDRAKIDIPLTLPKIGRTIADRDRAATARPGALQWRISAFPFTNWRPNRGGLAEARPAYARPV